MSISVNRKDERFWLISLTQIVRNFFIHQEFVDCLVPIAVEHPGMETHLHPFQLYSCHEKKARPSFLHTSPEFMMKELLAQQDFENIFTINYCFRDEPNSDHHRFQFLMLEWYRKNQRYEKIMADVQALYKYCFDSLKKINAPLKNYELSFQKYTVQEFVFKISQIDILNYLEKDKLYSMLTEKFKQLPLPPKEQVDWTDLFFIFFLNIVEPQMENIPFLLLYEFPAPLTALSTIKESDARVCERFEVYCNGIELCNAFNELTDLSILKNRFSHEENEKKNLYHYELPRPERFYQIMKNYPSSSGIALGIERLLLSLLNVENPFFD